MNFNATLSRSSNTISLSTGYFLTTASDEGDLSSFTISPSLSAGSASSATSKSSLSFSIVMPSSLRLDGNETDSTTAASSTGPRSTSSSGESVQGAFTGSHSYNTSRGLEASSSSRTLLPNEFTSLEISSSTALTTSESTGSMFGLSSSIHSSISWNQSSADMAQTRDSSSNMKTTSLSDTTSSSLPLASSSQSSDKLSSTGQSSPYATSSTLQNSTPMFLTSQTLVAPSFSSLPSSSYQESVTSSILSLPSSLSDSGFSISTSSDSIYLFYTQMYEITGSSTTFETGLPTKTVLNINAATSGFNSQKTTMTTGVDFYERWMRANQDRSRSNSSQANRDKIIGGVVGGVGGFIACCLVIFFIYWKRRTGQRETVKGFSSEIGRRAGYPWPASGDDTNEEKDALDDHNADTILARIRNGTMLRNKPPQQAPLVDESDPFQNEFNFESRRRPRPPLPPPRKAASVQNQPPTSVESRNVGQILEMDPEENRYSYISSMSESSALVDDSTMSSTSIRLGMYGHNNTVSDSTQGFFREVI
ncbi:hypothetical protein HG535_0G01480 [Zygotorulaspora mrakii]|uniref:Mid2 domain-containing protein n=1 Tax=Zygotorulaspora mrakii TaxID=42260 RepID=A0A7H9B7P5_ZYGMR|nr:uncharacterized protein HG535_0G01480 [Zygotorulaspora mrakii]QLG74264.1 hypothetical protein HG535_0G01480 [Zygotorulaspora mrakii]